LTNLWPDLPRRREKELKIRSEKGDTAEIQKKKKRKYYEKLYANKFDNLEKNGQFSRDTQPTKTESRKYRSVEHTNH